MSDASDAAAVLGDAVLLDGTTPQADALGAVVAEHLTLRNQLAGLLSTIDITPSQHHPQDMIPWADAVLKLLTEGAVP